MRVPRIVDRTLAPVASIIAATFTFVALATGSAAAASANVPATAAACTTPAPSAPPTLAVSKIADLSPAGETLTVVGSGFFECHGVYIAFCVMPPPGEVPSPCGGGIDLQGDSGASQWISSYPPAYGVGLAVPYGAGGTFTVSLHVSPMITPDIDCRQVQCAVVTRNDHTRTDDRTQDVLVPVTFAAPPAETVPPTLAPATTTAAPVATVPATTVRPPAAVTTAPPATVAATPTSTTAPPTSPPATTSPTSTTAAASSAATTTTRPPAASTTSTSTADSTTSSTSSTNTVPVTAARLARDGGDSGTATWIIGGVGALLAGGTGTAAWLRLRRPR